MDVYERCGFETYSESWMFEFEVQVRWKPVSRVGETGVKDRWPVRSGGCFHLGHNKKHFTAQWERHESIKE